MTIETRHIDNLKVAEIIADDLVLKNTEDGLQLLGDLYYQGYDKILIHAKNIIPEFFDLKNGIAGEVLQKFAQYGMPLTIIGDFSKLTSKSVQDFIYESNKGRHVNFVSSVADALRR